MVYRLRYICILVYLMHDMSIQLFAIQALCSALLSGKQREFNSGCFQTMIKYIQTHLEDAEFII